MMSNPLLSLYRTRAVKMYHHRCEALLEILGIANDVEATQRLVLTLTTAGRSNLAKPAHALTLWSQRRGRKALHGLKAALKEFHATPTFWSYRLVQICRSNQISVPKGTFALMIY